MTDKLVEQIKADRDAGTPGPWAVDFSYQWPSKVRAAPPFNERWICDASAQPSPNDQSHTLANASRIARVPDMEARILADEQVIKAAEELAVEYGSLIEQVDRLQEFNLNSDRKILAAFRQAQQTRAALEKFKERQDDGQTD